MEFRRLIALLLAAWLPLSGVAAAGPSVTPTLPSAGSAPAAFQPAAAAAALDAFFASPAPDLGAARSVSSSLGAIDTTDPAVLRRLEPVLRSLRAAAGALAVSRVEPKSTEAGLAATALKLQALNQPELRNLLEPAQQRAVGSAYWAYQTHLTRDVRLHDWAPSSLTLERKIEGIARALRASASVPHAEAPRLLADSGVTVEVVGGDVSRRKADALISALQPSGLCEGGINAVIERVGGPGFRAQIERAKPLADGRAWVARGDASNAGLFDAVVFVTDAMRLPLRELVSRALRAADDAGLVSVSLPALRTGWNFGFLETSYEEIVAETLRGVRLFEERGRGSLRAISLVVHNNPRLQRLFEAGVRRPSSPATGARAEVERLAARLARRPINDARYGSENAFLAEFTRAARSLFPAGARSPETSLLLALEPKPRGPLFAKNMAILADDLYLSVGGRVSAADRYELARLRSRFGSESVAPQDPASGALEAPKPRNVRGGWLAWLLPGALGRALGAALGFIAARDLSILGFPSVAERWARSPELRRRLEDFHDRLSALSEDFPSKPETSIWELALEVNGGNARDAADMLGGLVGQTKRPLRYLERSLLGRFPEAAGAQPAFLKAARSYYLLGELHEKGLRRFGRSPLYPEGSGASGPKFWHFYGAAMVASRLGRQPAWAARAAGALIAVAYEAATFPTNLGLFGAGGLPRGISRTLADSRRDVAQHLRGHAFGRGLAAGLSLAEEPVATPGGVGAAFDRARGRLLDAWWKFWWEAGPPTRREWREYASALEAALRSGRRPAAKDPRGLFVGLRLLGLAFNLSLAPSSASDAVVMREARALFERHLDAGEAARAAFDRLLERARSRYSGKNRVKLRALAGHVLREASILRSSEVAAYLDAILAGSAAGPGPEAALADFRRLAERAVVTVNREALPGRRVLGFLVSGSFAYGATRPGSDLDIQVVTEDGRAPADRAWLSAFEAEWRRLGNGIKLEVYSHTYLPPDRTLLIETHPDAYLLVSPYPETRRLAYERRSPTPETAALPSPALTSAGRGLLKAWYALLLAGAGGEASKALERERSLREDLRAVALSGEGFELVARPAPPQSRGSPIYRDMLEPWSLAKLLRSHVPVRLGTLRDRSAFSRPTVSVLNLPIQMPGTGLRIPAELEQFREFLQRMIDHEAAVNPRLAEFYAYLTVDQGVVEAGRTHRKPGIHIDGVQGARYPVKLPPEHTYSASDALGTVFYDQAFDLTGLDPARQHVHAELERQADEANGRAAEDYGIYFWDSYAVHRADTARAPLRRTFVRVEFSLKVYDSVGDTVSPLFDYHWPRVARPIPAALDDRPHPR